jgi:peptide/nickel transport system substrate-binding protein
MAMLGALLSAVATLMAAAAGVGAPAGAGAPAAAPPAAAPVYGGTLTVGLAYDIDTLNVYTTATLGDVESAVVEGLLAPDEHARYVPVLATEVPTLDNGGIQLTRNGAAMRVLYHLRPGVTWSDGAPLTSADVRFTWEAVKDPHFLAESKDGTGEVESIETPDDSTVIVNYHAVSPSFASTLFTFGILPRHLLLHKDLNHDPYNDKPLGTGPFIVREFRRGQYVLLERNPHYWRRDAHGGQLPYLDRIIYKTIPNSNTLGTLIRAGEVMLAPRLPFMLAKQLQGAANVELVTGPSTGWVHFDFGMKGGSLFRDPVLRRAVARAINRTALTKAAGGYPKPIYSVVLPLFEGLYDPSPEAAVPGYDPAAANRELDAAGYLRGDDGYRSRGGVPLSFGITTQSGAIDFEIAEQIIIANLKAIGIHAFADNKSGIAYREARYKGAFDLLYGHIVTAADPVYSVFYGSHGPLNGAGYADPAMDAALMRLETSIEPERRRAAAAEVQRIFAQDLPSLPLQSNVSIAAKTTRLRNFVINPTNMTDFISVATWYLDPAAGRSP